MTAPSDDRRVRHTTDGELREMHRIVKVGYDDKVRRRDQLNREIDACEMMLTMFRDEAGERRLSLWP